MKKKLFFAALALVALASCSDDTFVGDNSSNNVDKSETYAISFGSTSKGITRADYTGQDAATRLGNNFVVEGVKGNGTTQNTVFDHYNVNWADNTAYTTTSNTNNWEYVAQAKHAHASVAAQTIKYWDYSTTQYDFIAYSKGTATAIYTGTPTSDQVLYSAIDPSKMKGTNDAGEVQTDVANITKGAYTITGTADQLAKCYIADLVTVYRDGSTTNDAAGDYNKVVQFNFRSLSAKVRVALYETVPGYSVKDVTFYTDASTAASDSKAHLYTEGSDVFNESGSYIVYYPTTGDKTATDNNKAHLKFVPATSGTAQVKVKDFGERDVTTNVIRETAETASTADKLYLGRSSNEATYFGPTANDAHYYTVVIPNETGAVLNLKVNYTLLATDGSGEVINVTGATAKVPAVYASWKSGYAYTYIFKISQNSNGLTNPDITGVVGLYPITFDAVVTESEDGVQETITTVADPSITTYAKGAVASANNEYTRNTNIYIIVDNGTALTTSNAKMYKITPPADGAAQTVNEASIANLLEKGTYTNGTWSVTDANNKTMSASLVGLSIPNKISAADAPDGNDITVNCALFNTTIAGTYAFEYIDSSNEKHYKIIIIQ